MDYCFFSFSAYMALFFSTDKFTSFAIKEKLKDYLMNGGESHPIQVWSQNRGDELEAVGVAACLAMLSNPSSSRL